MLVSDREAQVIVQWICKMAYFLRFIVLVHISSRPSLASDAGKLLMAWAALSAYSCANARVCSRPSLRVTMSLAYRLLTSAYDPMLGVKSIPFARRHHLQTFDQQERQAPDALSRRKAGGPLLDQARDQPRPASQALLHL